MKKKSRLASFLSLCVEIVSCLSLMFLCMKQNPVVCELFTGRVDHSINEMTRLNGRMTPREAAIKCELDDECAGFTYHGPKTLPDDHTFQVTFYLYVIHILTSFLIYL